MLKRLTQRLEAFSKADDELHLGFDSREKARCRVTSVQGDDVGIFVERGGVLREGDCLRGDGGRVYRIVAKPEPLSVVRPKSSLGLARAAYHLGNRHVRLQVTQEYLAYQPDHVLDEMVRGLGFSLTRELLPFEPEAGAYQRGGHDHGHGHDHGDAHDHDHDHHHSETEAILRSSAPSSPKADA